MAIHFRVLPSWPANPSKTGFHCVSALFYHRHLIFRKAMITTCGAVRMSTSQLLVSTNVMAATTMKHLVVSTRWLTSSNARAMARWETITNLMDKFPQNSNNRQKNICGYFAAVSFFARMHSSDVIKRRIGFSLNKYHRICITLALFHLVAPSMCLFVFPRNR